MEFGTRFLTDINGIFRVRPRDVLMATASANAIVRDTSFSKGNVYSKFLVSEVGADRDSWEIPLIMREHSENMLLENHKMKERGLSEMETGTLVYPLYVNGQTWTKSTFDTIIRCFFYYTKPENRICTVKLKQSNLIWHGGRGIIMDRNFNILLLITMLIERSGEDGFRYAKTICRLNPKLFPTKDIMSRGIVNKLVPLLTQEGIVPSYTYHRALDHFDDCHHSIGNLCVMVDSDINRFIVSPVVPSTGISDDELHQCIIDNKQEILKMVNIP